MAAASLAASWADTCRMPEKGGNSLQRQQQTRSQQLDETPAIHHQPLLGCSAELQAHRYRSY